MYIHRVLQTIIVALIMSSIGCAVQERESGGLKKIYSANNVSARRFEIDPRRDTIIRGEGGVEVMLDKNTFVDSLGQAPAGSVVIVLRAILSPADMVLTNMTTTSNGQVLQSGGMIYIGANENGKALQIASDKNIRIRIPADSVDLDMEVYEGVRDSSGINWVNPTPLLNSAMLHVGVMEGEGVMFFYEEADPSKPADTVKRSSTEAIDADLALESFVSGFYPLERDTTVLYNGKKVRLLTWNTAVVVMRQIDSEKPWYVANYVLAVKKLGWVNVDKLLDDPRAQQVDLTVSVEDRNEFSELETTLVVSKLGIYLTAHERDDKKTYSFDDPNYGPLRLPIGEKETLVITALKDNKPYVAIKPITLRQKQLHIVQLEETTMEKLKAQITNLK